jgi:hypothetical protein
MNDIEFIEEKGLPCYECLCLAACRWRNLEELMKCDRAFKYLMNGYVDYPYDAYQYDVFLKFMRVEFPG